MLGFRGHFSTKRRAYSVTLGSLRADVIETKNGARIVGKVLKIDAGSVVVDTDYAGKIAIKQSEVTAITTDAPISVRLASGTRIVQLPGRQRPAWSPSLSWCRRRRTIKQTAP